MFPADGAAQLQTLELWLECFSDQLGRGTQKGHGPTGPLFSKHL